MFPYSITRACLVGLDFLEGWVEVILSDGSVFGPLGPTT